MRAHKKHSRINRWSYLALIAIMAALYNVPSYAGSANLTPPGGGEELSGCATDTWTAMVNQSVLQTRRQDIANKRLIIKPDSVFDYTCFSHIVKTVAEEAGPIFSESEKWVDREVDLDGKEIILQRKLGSKSLDNALMEVVETALINYKRGQFNNGFLADSVPVSSSAGKKYCDTMSEVWKAAKCKNFDGMDIFYTFEDLIGRDPREFPLNMRCD